MAQKEDEHRVIGGTAIEKKKKSKTTEENGAIKMKGNRNDNINEEGEQRGPEGGRDTGEEEITKKKKKKKSKTTEENGAIKMKGNRNDNINEEGEQRGPEEGGRDTGEQEITKKKKKKKKVNQEYGHSPDTEEGGQEMRKMVVKTTGTEPVEDRDEEENPKLKKKKKKHKSEESEEIQQHPVKAVKQKQAGAEKRKKKRKHKEMEQEEGGGVEVEEEKGVCAKKKKRVNDGRGRQEDGGVIEPEGSKEKQLKKRKKRLVEQEEGTEGKKKQKGLPSKTVSPHQEMPNKQIDKKKKMKKYLCSEETEGVEKEEMGTVTKKKGKKKAKLDAIQEGDDVEREDGDGGSLKKKQKKKKVMEEVKLLTAMEKNNKGVKVKIKIEDEYSGNKPEFEIVSVKPGNTDEVNIDKERRRALQEEIDRESCPPPHDPSQVTGASFGQWGTATFGNVDRQNKFLRLMGGFKKSGQSMVPEGGVKAERPNMALNQADQDQLTRGLQGEFDRAQNRRLHPQQKGVGLGFQSAPSKSRIDREASKSIKFED